MRSSFAIGCLVIILTLLMGLAAFAGLCMFIVGTILHVTEQIANGPVIMWTGFGLFVGGFVVYKILASLCKMAARED